MYNDVVGSSTPASSSGRTPKLRRLMPLTSYRSLVYALPSVSAKIRWSYTQSMAVAGVLLANRIVIAAGYTPVLGSEKVSVSKPNPTGVPDGGRPTAGV